MDGRTDSRSAGLSTSRSPLRVGVRGHGLETKRDDAYFHTLFYLMVSASGVNARSQVMSCDGRIDLVMEFSDTVYVIEFKCNQTATSASQRCAARISAPSGNVFSRS